MTRVLILILGVCLSTSLFAEQEKTIHYIALGDSYTIGTGVSADVAWPSVMVAKLRAKGFPVELTTNLAHNGWTTQRLIDEQLPVLEQMKPDYASVLIGVNDWVHGVSADLFEAHLNEILKRMIGVVGKDHLLVVTIPDFSVTPTGKLFAEGRDISVGLAQFNRIITREAEHRGLKVVDIVELSKDMGKDDSLIAPDGLHPSAKEHARWSDVVESVFETMLRDKKS